MPIIDLFFFDQHDLNTVLVTFMILFFLIAVSLSIGLFILETEYRDPFACPWDSENNDFPENRAAKKLREFLVGSRSLLPWPLSELI